MSLLGIVLVVFLILVLIGGVGGPYIHPNWRVGYGTGYGGVGIIGVILLVLLLLILLGRFPY